MNITGELLALATGLLFAVSNIFNRLALDRMDKESGMVVTLIVNNVINASALLLLVFTGRWVPFAGWMSIFWFVLAGAFTSFVGRYLLFESVRQNGPSRAGAFKVASPVFTLFIGILIIGENVSPGSLGGAFLVLLGLYTISVWKIKDKEGSVSSIKEVTTKGLLIGLASGLAFALGQVARKVGLEIWPSALAGALTGSIVAFTLILSSMYISGNKPPWRDIFSKKSINYVWSGICTSFAIISFFLALHFTPVAIANVIGSLEPLFTIVLAFLILKERERITTGLLTGACLVTIGVSMIFFL